MTNIKQNLTQIDGARLKMARESKGLSPRDLAIKLCLSHRHIDQLESNQDAIFFTPAHKIFIAKKVGVLLGLVESDFLIHHIVENPQNFLPEDDKVSNHQDPAKHLNLSQRKDTSDKSNTKFFLITLAFVLVAVGFFVNSNLENLKIINVIGLSSLKNALPEKTIATDEPKQEIKASDAHLIDPKIGTGSTYSYPDSCNYQPSELISYQTSNPSKKGDAVYISSKTPQLVCVIDHQNKVTLLDLVAGQSRAIYGQPPFTIVSSNLAMLEMYFQGWRVKSEPSNVKALRLDETQFSEGN